MSVFVNRSLNLKKIKAIGFDMDYTLVRYHTKAFEEMAFNFAKQKLIELKGYPKELQKLKFDYDHIIQGLVIDKKRGNVLKLSRFGKVKTAFHGNDPIDFRDQQKIYANRVIDLNDSNIQSLDTSFSISNGVLFSRLVELKKRLPSLPSFEIIARDVRFAIDFCHADGSLKSEVRKNIQKFIIKDESVAKLLERLKRNNKLLLLITNSDFQYTKLLLDYTVNPFLKDHKDWSEVFDISVTLACKPRFFFDKNSYLSVDAKNGQMQNYFGKIESGIYQGGNAAKLQEDLNISGEDILYIGDHIYGDVVSLKKTFNWRTALVLDPLEDERAILLQNAPIQNKIDQLMQDKEDLETTLSQYELELESTKDSSAKEKTREIFSKIDIINSEISKQINEYNSHFNSIWGEMMRAGGEESRMADQVEKYACIYMSKLTDLLSYSPRTYFRPSKRMLPHESIRN